MPILLHVGVKHGSDVAVAFFVANAIVQGPNNTSHIVNWTGPGPAGLKEIESAVNSSTSPQLQGLTIIGLGCRKALITVAFALIIYKFRNSA